MQIASVHFQIEEHGDRAKHFRMKTINSCVILQMYVINTFTGTSRGTR
jgi:hypothetical protein